MTHVIKLSNVEMELVHDEEVEMDVVGEPVLAGAADQGVKGHNEDSEILLEFRYSLMIHMNQGMVES